MAPERLKGHGASAQSDLWSLGLSLATAAVHDLAIGPYADPTGPEARALQAQLVEPPDLSLAQRWRRLEALAQCQVAKTRLAGKKDVRAHLLAARIHQAGEDIEPCFKAPVDIRGDRAYNSSHTRSFRYE